MAAAGQLISLAVWLRRLWKVRAVLYGDPARLSSPTNIRQRCGRLLLLLRLPRRVETGRVRDAASIAIPTLWAGARSGSGLDPPEEFISSWHSISTGLTRISATNRCPVPPHLHFARCTGREPRRHLAGRSSIGDQHHTTMAAARLALVGHSRDVSDIRTHLQFPTLKHGAEYIQLENDSIQQDISRFVAFQVDHDCQLRRWGNHREKIKTYLTQHAGGVSVIYYQRFYCP